MSGKAPALVFFFLKKNVQAVAPHVKSSRIIHETGRNRPDYTRERCTLKIFRWLSVYHGCHHRSFSTTQNWQIFTIGPEYPAPVCMWMHMHDTSSVQISSEFRSGALASCCNTFRCAGIPLFQLGAQIQQAKRCNGACLQLQRIFFQGQIRHSSCMPCIRSDFSIINP